MKIIKSLSAFSLLLFLGILLPGSSAFSAETDKNDKWVEVPAALGPEAMTALVSNLDQEQTDALVKLMELLNTSAAVPQEANVAEQVGMLDTLEMWVSGFGQNLLANISGFPEMVSGAGQAIAGIFAGRGFGGSLLFIGLLILVVAFAMAAEWLLNPGRG